MNDLPPFTRYQVEPGVIHMTLPPRREPEWISNGGTIEGLHAIKYQPHADVQHDIAVARLVREVDGATWLAQHGLKCISVIVEFTEGGVNHWGKPIKTPAHVAHSRIDAEGQINVSSRVPLELVGPITESDREQFWFDWYSEVVAVLGRRRKLGMPGRRSEADIAAMEPATASDHEDNVEDQEDDAICVIEVHVPQPAGQRKSRSKAGPPWMSQVAALLASLDEAVRLEPGRSDGDGHYVFWLSGAETPAVLLAAMQVAGLPGVPPGAFAVFHDGAGTPDSTLQFPLVPEAPSR